MRSPIWSLLFLFCAGCAVRAVPAGTPPALSVAPTVTPAAPTAPEAQPVAAEAAPAVAEAAAPAFETCPADTSEAEGEDDEAAAAEDAGDSEEGEVAAGTEPTGPLYTGDISDEDLTRRWKGDVASLGSLAVGFVHSGRLVNGQRFPAGPEWIVVSPELAWATEETVQSVITAIREVRARFPRAPQLRVNQISAKEGGHLRPHKSHQNGRDVDLGFYYPTVDPVRERARERYIDLELNWAFVRALVTLTDAQLILIDHRVQKVLYDYALSIGEDKAWLDSLFNAGANSLIKHAPRHRDHFHVRFYNARAQELGRRVAPLLALQPEYKVATHRVRSGETLGGIALRYNSGVKAIQKANRMRNTFLRVGQVLSVPLRGPCTHCPVPPPVVVPPRRLPPQPQVAQPTVVEPKPEEAAPARSAAAPCAPPRAALAAP
ncbi:penicillin-insensitive murein endopeptidase [Myxococcaceae bacterium GXIMD 01537]